MYLHFRELRPEQKGSELSIKQNINLTTVRLVAYKNTCVCDSGSREFELKHVLHEMVSYLYFIVCIYYEIKAIQIKHFCMRVCVLFASHSET